MNYQSLMYSNKMRMQKKTSDATLHERIIIVGLIVIRHGLKSCLVGGFVHYTLHTHKKVELHNRERERERERERHTQQNMTDQQLTRRQLGFL